MYRYFFIGSVFILTLAACVTSRIAQHETVLFPEDNKGKWWIINTVLQDKYGKDIHFNSLVSLDKAGDKNYAACFVSVWTESGMAYYTGTRNVAVPGIRPRKKFPLRISFPANDSLGMEWSLVLKRTGLNFFTALNNKGTSVQKNYTELSAKFNKKDPFPISGISASPEAWAVDPITADVTMGGNIQASAVSKLLVRIFSDKEILLKRSSGTYVHWLDLSLSSGKQLSILFSTDTALNIQTEAVLLWNEQGNIMAHPKIILQKAGNDKSLAGLSVKPYPLFFSIEVPDEQLNIILQPRMREQEIAANKNSFWMGAVEATDKLSGQVIGKGNMYIFKQ